MKILITGANRGLGNQLTETALERGHVVLAATRSLKNPGDKEPKQGADMNYQCWVKDPDGNRIELMQYYPECPQLTMK